MGKSFIVGIGNKLKADDGAGCLLAERLIDKISAVVIDAGLSLENYSGKIIKYKPDTVIIIDAVLMNKKPGHSEILSSESLAVLQFSTHGLGLNYFCDYLNNQGINNLLIIGIQPESIEFGGELSIAVKNEIKRLENIFLRLFKR